MKRKKENKETDALTLNLFECNFYNIIEKTDMYDFVLKIDLIK